MTALRNVAAIVEKEWRHYFGSPIAWVVLVAWTFMFGWFFNLNFDYFVRVSTTSMQQAEMGGAPKLSINDHLLAPVYQTMAVISMFLTPMLTMRLFAEEKRHGTIELLATAPLTDLQIVLGKFVAALSLYGLMVLATLLDVAMVWHYSTVPPEWKPLATTVLALLLFGASAISLGLFISTLTRNQIVAGTVSFCVMLLMWTLSWGDSATASPIMKVVGYLGITTHLEDLMKGVLKLSDVVFYLSFTTIGLFLAHQSVESQRWRA
jgi:gliding motility-associated transport system permease protein